MDDRSRKIATLAQEMVRANMIMAPRRDKAAITFKTLFFAAMLAALGGVAIEAVNAELSRPVNRYEKTEIKALIFYAAREKNLNQDDLMNDLRVQFKIGDVDDMTERDFLAARRFLQDKIL